MVVREDIGIYARANIAVIPGLSYKLNDKIYTRKDSIDKFVSGYINKDFSKYYFSAVKISSYDLKSLDVIKDGFTFKIGPRLYKVDGKEIPNVIPNSLLRNVIFGISDTLRFTSLIAKPVYEHAYENIECKEPDIEVDLYLVLSEDKLLLEDINIDDIEKEIYSNTISTISEEDCSKIDINKDI
jgi:hypothetical protein